MKVIAPSPSAPPLPTAEQFLAATNGRARVRVFDFDDYEVFVEHVKRAHWAASSCAPYYWESNAGSVGRSYKYCADTARMGVYTVPPSPYIEKGGVCIVFDRIRASVNVKCIYMGGERSYFKWFRSQEQWF